MGNSLSKLLCWRQGANPFLVGEVAEKLLSFVDGNDLLRAREVCRLWYILGTERYLRVQLKPMEGELSSGAVCAIKMLLIPSQRVPVVRWRTNVSLLNFDPTALVEFLKFILPTAVEIDLRVNCSPHVPGHDRGPPNPSRSLESVNQLLLELDNDLDTLITLRTLKIRLTNEAICHPLRDPLLLLVQKLVKASHEVHSFGWICFDNDTLRPEEKCILNELSPGMQRLYLKGWGNGLPFYRDIEDLEFRLVELVDLRTFIDASLVSFLNSQKESLEVFVFYHMEKLYGQHYPFFPQLESVKVLKTDVTCNSDFDFVSGFPNLVELGIYFKSLEPKDRNKLEELQRNMQSLTPHPSVHRLFISNGSQMNPEQLPSFAVLVHCFPSVSHLAINIGSQEWMPKLTDIFSNFNHVETLCLTFNEFSGGTQDLESIFSGIPENICETLRCNNRFESPMLVAGVAMEENLTVGLSNLHKLRSLELYASQSQYSKIFTMITLNRVFTTMDSLKEILFGGEKDDLGEIIVALQPFTERLRVHGIDVYSMKRALKGCLFPRDF